MIILTGAALSVLGLIGIIYSIISIVLAKRAKLDDDALRARLGKLMPINLGALFISVIGLMVVVVGIVLA